MTSNETHHSEPITGHTDPADQAPWAMQLVVLIDKTLPPTRTAAIQATATAVATLLAHPDAAPGGPWHEAISRWTQGRIRKHCRRARGAAWDKVQDIPGVTVEVGGVKVRAFVPCPTDATAAPVAKLQMSGTELPRPDDSPVVEPQRLGAVVVSLCPAPDLSFGKAAAAAGHATQLAAAAMDPNRLEVWSHAGFPVAVEHPDLARWGRLLAQAPVRIDDAGFTEVEPGTTTAVARWA